MGIIVVASDFETGRFAIAQDSRTLDRLNQFITDFEKMYLAQLIGLELFDLFEADLTDRVPQTAIYQTIYNPFVKEINGCIVSSKGMKEMIKGLIYANYVSMQSVINKPYGNSSSLDEVSQKVNSNIPIAVAYNASVRTWWAIQDYILDNSTDYPTFNGEHIEFTTSL